MGQSKPAARKRSAVEPDGSRGIVISIDSGRRVSETAAQSARRAKPVTQARLAQGLQLHLQEMRIAQAVRDFRMQLEADLAAGSQIESGELVYDLQLKIVRKNVKNAIVSG